MIIKEVLDKLENSRNPVARALHKGHDFKVLVLGFKKGMVLKDHKAHLPAKLTVLEGTVLYEEDIRKVSIDQYDTVDIPIEVTHKVTAKVDSLCLLTQG